MFREMRLVTKFFVRKIWPYALLNKNLFDRAAYFNLLSEEEVWTLYRLYQPDFDLFGFEVEPSLLIRLHKTETAPSISEWELSAAFVHKKMTVQK